MSLQSIKFRLTLFCFSIGLIFCILVSIYYPIQTQNLLQKSSFRDYQFVNSILQKDLNSALSLYSQDNGKQLKETLKSYQAIDSNFSKIVKISVFNSKLSYLDGLNTQDSDKIGISYEKLISIELNDLFRVSGPLLSDDGVVIGYYRVDYSKNYLNDEITKVFDLAIYFGLITLLLIVIISLIFTKFVIVQPLSKLLKKINSEAKESLHNSSELDKFSNDMEKLFFKQIQNQKKLIGLIEELEKNINSSYDASAQAFKVSKSSDQESEDGLETMEKMGQSIQGILQASHDTEKVIASIEEIAKKSDVLTLNAFVEVRRSGEAGKVFAVIAEEIRKLTSQSTHAVNSTSSLVKSAIEKSQSGVVVSLALAETFKNLAQNNQKSYHLSSQLEELSKGHMDKVSKLSDFAKDLQQNTSKNDLSFHLSSELNKSLHENSQKLLDSLRELNQLISGE